ncbi:MAG: hypothetical protein ACRC2R_00235 [Xenococcaceae cyanobacterium]
MQKKYQVAFWLMMLGFVPQTPGASSRETRPTHWLPNLQYRR